VDGKRIRRDERGKRLHTCSIGPCSGAHKHRIPGSANCANRPQGMKHLSRAEGQGFWASESRRAYMLALAKRARRCR
jgi:hypothetical protein